MFIIAAINNTKWKLFLKGLNYEKLKGDKAGLSFVRVNDEYHIEFEERTVEEQTVATICNIVELSNHYKLIRDGYHSGGCPQYDCEQP